MTKRKDIPQRSAIHPGFTVDIVTKSDQKNGRTVQGTVKEILTNTSVHPHGIKVRLKDGRVGRVRSVISRSPEPTET